MAKVNFLKKFRTDVYNHRGGYIIKSIEYEIITDDLDDYGDAERLDAIRDAGLFKPGRHFHTEEIGCEEVPTWYQKGMIILNGCPWDIYNKMYYHAMEKAEECFTHSAACSVDKGNVSFRLYMDVSDDPNELGRTISVERWEDGEKVYSHKFDEYGGAKHAPHVAPKHDSRYGIQRRMIAEKK